ncbi:MAG: OpgC domain-containing protein, partial [Candidatus Binatia bacterium]
ALYFLFRHKTVLVLAGSVVLWGVGQVFDPLEAATHLFAPGHRSAYFNVLSWQLLYVLGLCLGYKYYRNESIRLLAYKPVLGLVFLCAFVLFLSRHSILLPELTTGLGRPRLEWLRLANVLLLAATIGAFLSKIPLHAQVPWLAFLGKHSLQVFSFHVALLYLLAPLTTRVAETLNTMWFTVFVTAVVICLSLPASLRSRYREWLLSPASAGSAPAS